MNVGDVAFLFMSMVELAGGNKRVVFDLTRLNLEFWLVEGKNGDIDILRK